MGVIQLGYATDRELTCRSSVLLSFSTSTNTFFERCPKHVDTSLLRESALLLLPLEICFISKLFRVLVICCTALTYFSICLYFVSNSPITWLAAKRESVRAMTLSAPILTANLRPAKRASYSALLLDVWKSKCKAYVSSSLVGLVRISPAHDPSLLEAPSMYKVQVWPSSSCYTSFSALSWICPCSSPSISSKKSASTCPLMLVRGW